MYFSAQVFVSHSKYKCGQSKRGNESLMINHGPYAEYQTYFELSYSNYSMRIFLLFLWSICYNLHNFALIIFLLMQNQPNLCKSSMQPQGKLPCAHCSMLNPIVPMPWFNHYRNFVLSKFGQFYINKHITYAKLHNFKQTDQRKTSKSTPKFR